LKIHTGFRVKMDTLKRNFFLPVTCCLPALLVLTLLMTGGLSACCFSQDSTRLVLIETSYGNIKLKLYNETPLHRDNFIKLIEKKFYDSLLFHRVIQGFMIQGGDPDSRNSLPPEFHPELFHKRGALAAARNPDEQNPGQESSGCQFYIVQGKVFTDSLLTAVTEPRITRMKAFNKVCRSEKLKDLLQLIEKRDKFREEGNTDSMKTVNIKIDKLTEAEMRGITPYRFSQEQRKVYTTLGGAPHLDGSYTVFGEVAEGMDVVDKIAAVPRDENNRPMKDVRMKISMIR
jgi:cyclophilin family peptidyl-prolyl cis-trans isomerase